MRVKQSVCFPIFVKVAANLDELFGQIKAVGYPAVEMWNRGDDFTDIMALAKQHGLAVASMIGHSTLENGLNKKENHDRVEKELTESIDLAVRFGVRGIICFSGNRNPGQSDEEGALATIAGLRRIAPYAEKKGVNLNLELLNSKVDHAGYQCDRTSWAVSVCQRVNSPRVRLLYDIYHMQIMEGDVIRTIRENIKWIGHFHTAGNPGRNEMDDSQELNYAGICRAIAATDYEGYVGHEFAPLGDVHTALRRAYETCNQGS